MDKTKCRDTVRAARIKKTAEIARVSERSVRRVLAGDQRNEEVMAIFFDLCEQEKIAYQTAEENHLIAELEKLIPIN